MIEVSLLIVLGAVGLGTMGMIGIIGLLIDGTLRDIERKMK